MQNLQQKLNNTFIRLAGIVKESIVDGKGIRASIYVQGCPHKCVGCHNGHTHDFNGGKEYSLQQIIDLILPNPLLDGITLSGGEPFCHAESLSVLAEWAKQNNLNIWCYSGYTYEELLELSTQDVNIKNLLDKVDVLVDGKFIESQKDLTLAFRGSKNQRIIELAARATEP